MLSSCSSLRCIIIALAFSSADCVHPAHFSVALSNVKCALAALTHVSRVLTLTP